MNTINKACRRWLFSGLSYSMSGPQYQPMWCVPLLVWVKIAGTRTKKHHFSGWHTDG